MNREDIIRMAREADACHDNVQVTPFLERFAALVAAHVRETEFKPDWNNYRQGLADGADEEREACAKVCESLFDMDDDSCNEAEQCAAAIRARGRT